MNTNTVTFWRARRTYCAPLAWRALRAGAVLAALALCGRAALINPDFETGDYSGWTRSGAAWGGAPSSATWPSSGFHGSFHANSYFGGETSTGTLRSSTFTLAPGGCVDFLMGGWRSAGVAAESNWNYVALCRADDGAELTRIYAPNITGAMTTRRLAPGLSSSTDVYLLIVDDSTNASFAWLSVDQFTIFTPFATDTPFDFEAGTYTNWVTSGTAWGGAPVTTNYAPWFFATMSPHGAYYANSLVGGEAATGTLRTIAFAHPSNTVIRCYLAGWSSYGLGGAGGAYNYVALRRAADGFVYTNIFAPNQTAPMVVRELNCPDAYGHDVYIEAVDNCPSNGFAWLAVDYFHMLPTYQQLYGVIVPDASERTCGNMPFIVSSNRLTSCTINSTASVVHLLGMINTYDNGCAHWGGHPELQRPRQDQHYIGNRVGTLRLVYADASSDSVPLDFGATIWSYAQWGARATMEPFVSRPAHAAVWSNCFMLKQNEPALTRADHQSYFYLSLRPAAKMITRIDVLDNSAVIGAPLITAITLDGAAATNTLRPFGPRHVTASERAHVLDTASLPDWSNALAALAECLYTHERDVPETVDIPAYPASLQAAELRFHATPAAQHFADMLSAMWSANIIAIDEKFYAHNGAFNESGENYPYYGSYNGIGTWGPEGVYFGGVFGRCSDHFASLALRCIQNDVRITNYINYCDQQLYYYRSDHDPANGPPNAGHDITRYPTNAPPHWGFVISAPGGMPGQINEIFGDEETDGHGATMVGRWLAWRHIGAPTSGWFTAARTNVYGKSPWRSTIDAAEFVCWLLDYTGRDVVWCEGETTGWGGHGALVPPNMTGATTRAQVLTNYALADMYEPYPSYLCMIGLRCSAQIADTLGETSRATRWRAYAARIHHGMTNELTVSYHGAPAWRQCAYSVYPSFQDSLVPAWFAIYADGLDPNALDAQLMAITRNTLARQTNQPWGHAQVLGMGYGQGWLAKAALLLDAMDDAGMLLTNMAKYSYDKNMDYADPARGIDWRLYQWIVPEGVNILPDGSWYRISDLGNGANQGIALHALELCAGIDDTHPDNVKILPRTPAPLSGITVSNFPVLVPRAHGHGALSRAIVHYTYRRDPALFALASSTPLPTLAVRLGPYTPAEAGIVAAELTIPAHARVRRDTSGFYGGSTAHWVWVEQMTNISALTLEIPEPAGELSARLAAVLLARVLHARRMRPCAVHRQP